MTEPCVEIEGVTKRFGEDLVLKEVNLVMESGKVYGIVGNNGSGKTVLMKCICGFLPPSSGRIRVFGKRIGVDRDFPESLGVIIETPGFLTNQTGIRNLKILADLNRKIGETEIRQVLNCHAGACDGRTSKLIGGITNLHGMNLIASASRIRQGIVARTRPSGGCT